MREYRIDEVEIEIDGLGRFVISREDGTVHDFEGQGRESAFAKTPAGFLLALIFDAENEDRIPELAEKLEEQGITPEILHRVFTDEAMTKAEKEEFLYLFSGGDDRWRFGGGFNNVDDEVYETLLEKLEEAGLTEDEARERLEEVFEEAVRISSFGFENVRDEVEKEVKSELERLKGEKNAEDYLYGLLEAVERVNETLNEAYRDRLYEALAEELPELREDSSLEP